MAGRGDIRAGRAYVELFVKNSRFIRGLNAAKQRLQQFGSEMTALGRQMTILSGSMLLPLAFASKTFADFDDAMRSVQAVTGATDKDFQQLTETAKLLGRTTSFTATEVASLMTELGRAGFAAQQIDEMTGSVLSLARATSTEAPVAAGIMSASIRQFGLEAEDAGRVADSLTAAANKSFNTVEGLGESLKFAGPVAADFNMSLEDTLAVLGGLGNLGIQGSAAGTAIRRLLTVSASDAEGMAKRFDVAFTDAAGNMRPLVDVLDEVGKATEDLGSAERAKMLNEAFGLRGITGASAIGKSAGDVRQLAEEIKNAGGLADETAEKMDAGLGGAFRVLRSAAEGVAIAVGEALSGALTSVVKSATDMLGVVTKIVKQNKDAVVTFGKWAVAIGAAGVAIMGIGLSATLASAALGGLMGIFGLITATLSGLVGVIGFLLTPMGLLTAALVSGVAAWTKFSDKGKESIKSLSDTVGSLLADLKETFSDTMGGIMDAISAGDLSLAGEIAMTGLQLAFQQGTNAILSVWNGLIPDMVAMFSAGMKSITENWRATQNAIMKGVLKVGEAMTDTSGRAGFTTGAEDGRGANTLQSAISNREGLIERAQARGDESTVARLQRQQELDRERLKGIEEGTIASPEQNNPFADMLAEMDKDAAAANEASQRFWDSIVPTEEDAKRRAEGVATLRKELEELRNEAKRQREVAEAEPFGVLASDVAGGVQDGGAGGAAASRTGGVGKASNATFSAAGFMSMAQGSSSPMVRKTEELKRTLAGKADQQIERLDQIIDKAANAWRVT